MALLEEPDAEARSAQDWLDRLTELAFAHIDNEEQFDDLTLLVLKILA
jgi:serine phosphatase RsbU (regulator of sigma subunit)